MQQRLMQTDRNIRLQRAVTSRGTREGKVEEKVKKIPLGAHDSVSDREEETDKEGGERRRTGGGSRGREAAQLPSFPGVCQDFPSPIPVVHFLE